MRQVLDQLSGDKRLIVALLYGSGLRLMECLRLRIQDVDLERHEIMVRDGKDSQDRLTIYRRRSRIRSKSTFAVSRPFIVGIWMRGGAGLSCQMQLNENT